MQSPLRIRFIAAILSGCALTASTSQAVEDFSVLKTGADGTAPGEQFERWLKSESYRLLDWRREAVEKLKSVADCRNWQQERRAFFLNQIGGLPERTPLNPQIVGVLQGKGYRVEKIIFESRPGFHVTANLYLPDSPPPWPAVIVPVGHSHDGKAWGSYQRTCILLARHGMAAMCYDPVGQGERYQMPDLTRTRTHFIDSATTPVPHPNVQYLCTIEHTSISLSSALLGGNAAQYRIWDGMRAIDYLQSRSDIHADKIGCAGQSGGGTLTAYLMALDARIVAAAPVGFLTTLRWVLDSKSGPQDGEQNIFGQIGFGMDEADYVSMRAADVQLWTQFLRNFQASAPRRSVHLVAQGGAAIPALHGAALASETFDTVTLKNMVRSWEEMVGTPEPTRATDVVHGALRNYTLADLVETVGPSKVSFVQPTGVSGSVAAGSGKN